jgi:hypothetical protein
MGKLGKRDMGEWAGVELTAQPPLHLSVFSLQTSAFCIPNALTVKRIHQPMPIRW